MRPLPTAAAPKIAALARLQAAGLPVPAAIALPDTSEPDAGAWAAIDELLRLGPVIVRAALLAEDTADASGAGLGRSVADCHDRDAVRTALADITAALADPWLRRYFDGPPAAEILVQRQVLGPWLAVVAQTELRYVELHRDGDGDGDEALAAGHTPALAGPLPLFPPELRAPIADLCERATAALPPASHGLDLELVADHDGAVWVVQARPLTRPLHPGWPAFAATVRRELGWPEGQPLPLPGLWVLDAEHNPAPLSPAHAGLVRWLCAAHPALAHMQVLAGWLYVPGRLTPRSGAAAPDELRRALHDLRTRHIPAARERLQRIDRALLHVDAAALAALIDRAGAELVRVLEVHAALPSARPRHLGTTGTQLCLQDREAHLDVLPAAWDIASPPLAELALDLGPGPSTPAPAPTDPDRLAILIGELDDHLFALGLAPLRRVYLRAAEHLGLAPRDIFLLPPSLLRRRLLHPDEPLDLATRHREHAHALTLYPPLQLYDGLPVPSPGGGHLRGLPIGPAAEGPLHVRRDLEDLGARPLPPGAVLAIPALTAQAAVVLRALGIRAVCCEHGGALSHAALMARELGLSALIGCRGCTAIAPGTRVRLDPRSGRLLRLT